jgi:hypothetical protein
MLWRHCQKPQSTGWTTNNQKEGEGAEANPLTPTLVQDGNNQENLLELSQRLAKPNNIKEIPNVDGALAKDTQDLSVLPEMLSALNVTEWATTAKLAEV